MEVTAIHSIVERRPERSASVARLHYVTDSLPGIRRVRRGKSFIYLRPNGKRLRAPKELARIKAIVIPPAWTDVWICPNPNGHLQATGRDAKGRKQHRYHPKWKETRDATKFDRMLLFGQALPRLRRRVARDLKRPGLPREKVVAAVVKLLETSLIRIGNEEYARQNDSFGLTTLRTRHVDVVGSRVRFEFRGKSGIQHTIDLHDDRMAKIVRACQAIPGHELFQYIDEQGRRHSIGSADVNEYVRQATRQDFTSKDFRTWAGTTLAARALRECDSFTSRTQAKRNVARAVEWVAKHLRNTKTVCRTGYIHPAVIDAYLDQSLTALFPVGSNGHKGSWPRGIKTEEKAVLKLLRQRSKAKR